MVLNHNSANYVTAQDLTVKGYVHSFKFFIQCHVHLLLKHVKKKIYKIGCQETKIIGNQSNAQAICSILSYKGNVIVN